MCSKPFQTSAAKLKGFPIISKCTLLKKIACGRFIFRLQKFWQLPKAVVHLLRKSGCRSSAPPIPRWDAATTGVVVLCEEKARRVCVVVKLWDSYFLGSIVIAGLHFIAWNITHTMSKATNIRVFSSECIINTLWNKKYIFSWKGQQL